ncbi:E1A [Bottlenose dolphin adenovirus 1]|uniref:E1A n=1 Tax=Bottlenose dolphin adenovirus 1 TaxID=1714377 RepID=A0A1X7MPX5_9ADEN|nr:E1A [Bottlenose dolphin adenovirus 1]SMG83435.1 E1A [Bottlenose dolphin adenovirus 1]
MRAARLSFDPDFFSLESDYRWNCEAVNLIEDEELNALDPMYDEGFSEPFWYSDVPPQHILDGGYQPPPPIFRAPLPPVGEHEELEIDLRCVEQLPDEILVPRENCEACAYAQDMFKDLEAKCLFCAALDDPEDPLEGSSSGVISSRKRCSADSRSDHKRRKDDDDDVEEDDSPCCSH